MISVRDVDGFAPIGDYGVIGNGRGVALVAADGCVDWWAAPFLDNEPAFAALLDPAEGGRIELHPVEDDVTVRRRYVPNTNVLETTFTTPSGRVRITDSINSGNAGPLPWTELARRIDGVKGTVELRFAVVPGSGLGSWSPWISHEPDRGPVIHACGLTFAVRYSDNVTLDADGKLVGGSITVSEGERAVLAVVATDEQPLFLPDADAIDHRIDVTIGSWRHWTKQVQWDGPRRDQVVRSALAFKLLMMNGSGAIAAAATTSLPESVGGSKNWDYRFAWIRDAALTIDAMRNCGLQEEVHAALVWLLRAIRDNGPDVHVMYTLNGDVPGPSRRADVPGYKHSRPVMVGNDAAGQVQLGVYGDLFGTVADWVFAGHILDTSTSRQLGDLADRCADIWRRDDAGIWELEDVRPYTSSKMNCWRALDAAARLAEAGQIAGSAKRWRTEADHVRGWVEENCWSEHKQAYTFYAGGDDLDASVLSKPNRGHRMSTTADAIIAELGTGPLLYRYSGMDRQEQAFIACSYWLVEALAYCDRGKDAERLMTELDPVASPLGLLTEMCVPGTNELVGNLPQALSHLAMINAAAALRGSTPTGT